MSAEENVRFLQELLLLCDQISTWCYDANGELLFSNSGDEAVLNTAFSSFGCRDWMLRHIGALSCPVYLGSAVGLMWGATGQRDETGALQRVWVLGPVFYTSGSKRQMELGRGDYQGLELSVAWKAQLVQAVRRLPVVTNVLLGRYLLMLHYAVTGQKLRYSDITVPAAGFQPEAELPRTERDRNQVYAAERAMLDMVRNGDLNYREALSNSVMLSSGVPLDAGDALRKAKTNLAVFTTMVSRAAIEGGLSPEEAYSLGDAYIQSGENARSLEELIHLSPTMYDDFIRRVRRCRTNPRYSQAVQKCVDYIELHLEERIRAADLARMAGYDEYYLTRLFKKETGLAVSDYVKFAKVERAKVLLKSTRLSVQEIADKLAFSSRSYFIHSFRSVTGQTPTQWRGGGSN